MVVENPQPIILRRLAASAGMRDGGPVAAQPAF
jgi:hypothetical protein